jgi:hypothetical protein
MFKPQGNFAILFTCMNPGAYGTKTGGNWQRKGTLLRVYSSQQSRTS